MNEIEKAYCKHDLNILFGENVDTESHYPKTQVSSMYGMMGVELDYPDLDASKFECLKEYPFGFILPDVEI